MKKELTNGMIEKLIDAYASNKEALYDIHARLEEYGILDNGITDISDTFEMGYNNALEYVFAILGIKGYER